METNTISPLPPRSGQTQKDLLVREMEHHMDVEMFLEGHTGWEVDSPIAPSSCMRCSNMPQSKGRRRQNV